MRYLVNINRTEHAVEVVAATGASEYFVRKVQEDLTAVAASERLGSVSKGAGIYRVYLAGRVHTLVLEHKAGKLAAEVNGFQVEARVLGEREATSIGGRKAKGRPDTQAIHAQMPGRILEVKVAPGESVVMGQPLLVIEAMKMENEILAEAPGTVAQLLVGPGDAVEAGAPLLVLKQ